MWELHNATELYSQIRLKQQALHYVTFTATKKLFLISQVYSFLYFVSLFSCCSQALWKPFTSCNFFQDAKKKKNKQTKGEVFLLHSY